MRTIHQCQQENPGLKDRGMIDDFRLRGSSSWRRMGVPLSDGGWRMQVVHTFGNHKTALSEGAALAAVVEAIPENPHWTRVGTDSPHPVRQSAVGRRPACPPPRTARRGATGRGRKWRERPPVFRRRCATGQGEMVHAKIHHLPSPVGGRALHIDPCRKASGRPFVLTEDEYLPV